MTREEALGELRLLATKKRFKLTPGEAPALDMAIKALEQETYANIPFLLHKEFGCPLDECVKAYDVAIDYLRRQGKVRG